MTTFALPLLVAGMQAATPVAVTPTEESRTATNPVVSPTLPPAALVTDGGIIITAAPGGTRADPFEDVNVQAFDAVQSVDKAVTGPVSMGYEKTFPNPVRYGVRNFLSNLREPIVFINYLLQLKPGKAIETGGRFGINSTLGFLGLFDTAKKKPFHLPRRKNGFGHTLGYYGVKPGPFLFLPLIGPSTLRDLVGRIADLSVLPYAVGSPFGDPLYAIPTTTIRLLDERVEADEELQARRDGDQDPYTAMKKQYLRTRQAEIDALHRQR